MVMGNSSFTELWLTLWSVAGLSLIGPPTLATLLVVALVSVLFTAAVVFFIAKLRGHANAFAARCAAIASFGFFVPLVTFVTAPASIGYALWLVFAHEPTQAGGLD
jgi:O-antigen/teichoic acid export membrane protein